MKSRSNTVSVKTEQFQAVQHNFSALLYLYAFTFQHIDCIKRFCDAESCWKILCHLLVLHYFLVATGYVMTPLTLDIYIYAIVHAVTSQHFTIAPPIRIAHS